MPLSPQRRTEMYGKIGEWIESRSRNAWVISEDFKLYLRRGIHAIGPRHDVYVCLDIANVETIHHREGIFKEMLKACQALCPWNGVYMENVSNPHLEEYLRKLAMEDGRWLIDEQTTSFLWLKDAEGRYHYFRPEQAAQR